VPPQFVIAKRFGAYLSAATTKRFFNGFKNLPPNDGASGIADLTSFCDGTE